MKRAQQGAFLPYVEDGTAILVGATTENPSFELIGALLSRAQVFVLRRLDDDDLEILLRRAEEHLGQALPLTGDGYAALRATAASCSISSRRPRTLRSKARLDH